MAPPGVPLWLPLGRPTSSRRLLHTAPPFTPPPSSRSHSCKLPPTRPTSLRSHKDLLNTRSITTIGQQTHHVAILGGEGDAQLLQAPSHTGSAFFPSPQLRSNSLLSTPRLLSAQVGTATLTACDIMLPNTRGVLHVVDSVMCCLRLLQHCRFEQVWNKTVRPAPKLALQGEWQPQLDELHAILIHCDSWQPLFQGLRGAQVPLFTTVDRASKSFTDGIIHFHELLILEKPPESE